MRVPEAARRMGVARQSVDAWLDKGWLPFRYVYEDGKTLRDITLSDLMDFDREWKGKAARPVRRSIQRGNQ